MKSIICASLLAGVAGLWPATLAAQQLTLDEAVDRAGLFGDVAQAITAGDGSMTGIKAGVVGGNQARMKLEVRVRDLEHLYLIVARLNAVKGMIQVSRG
ncbi:MAG: hypothetical protein CVV55_05555 [Synergistetes bacterium HGW-Synergistetes-2]|nr:MAG: hypothetical protein CVV55_05555 [Synergistetes bacterium HGW-Synergistetes-2]